MRTQSASRLAILACTGMFTFAAAAPCMADVTIDLLNVNEGNTTALLERTSQHYVDAMRRIIAQQYPGGHEALRWERLEAAMRDKAVGRFEYRYTSNGAHRMRVYHAMGGKPLSLLARDAFEEPMMPLSPLSSTASEYDSLASDGEGTGQGDGLVDADAGDSAFFRGFQDIEARAPLLNVDSSAMAAFYVDDRDRAFDPEFKALRALEADIKAGRVSGGGQLRGAVSGTTCESCRYAMNAVSRSYGVDVRITQMFGSVAPAEQARLVQSGVARLRRGMLVDATSGEPLLAAHALQAARDAQIRRSLGSRPMARSASRMQWQPRSFVLAEEPPPTGSDGAPEAGIGRNYDTLGAAEPEC